MRFDDRLQTAIRGAPPEGLAAAMQWRQIVDLLAQKPGEIADRDIQAGLERLRILHDRVPLESRVDGVRALRGRLRSAPLLVYLCADEDEVCDAAIAAADVGPEIWEQIEGSLSPYAVNRLGEATGLRFGPERAVAMPVKEPPESPAAPDPVDAGQSQISQLVTRIDDYRRSRDREPGVAAHRAHLSRATTPIKEFAFLTDIEGTITDAVGLPRGAIVGTGLAEPAFGDLPGPDASVAAAFGRRTPIANGRVRLRGAPVIDGIWLISADPVFSEGSGRFEGYRGKMRRLDPVEQPIQSVAASQDGLRQLIHELRTPLNAISGFSEIIAQQLFGPVSAEYRSLGSTIQFEARKLMSHLDDLSASIEAGSADHDETARADRLLERLAERLGGLAADRGVVLSINKAEPIRAFAHGLDAVERVCARLLSTCIAACDRGEKLDGTLRTLVGAEAINRLDISRPRKLQGLDEQQLFDTEGDPDQDGDGASMLGLGFSLRLVSSLASAIGGRLSIDAERIILTLPAAASNAARIPESQRD